jgi:hypothetical protein
MIKRTLAAGAAAAALGMGVLVPAGAAPGIDGLWGTTTTGGATNVVEDCGEGGLRAIDPNGFCFIDDSESVELGVKFTTSEPVVISGIRAYRVDPGEVTGTLWTVAGEKLASGKFVGTDIHSWQDLTFDSPVTIFPGETYVASYYSPNSDYAFKWYYFTDTARTSGPLTATASIEGDRNGVFCYGTSCGVPAESFKDTNYWVTPVIEKHAFSGFHQPIDTVLTNEGKAGRAIPVKFSLGGDKGLDILREGYPRVTKFACEAGEATDTIEETVSSNVSGLKYDQETGQYMYVWKTHKSMAKSCYKFELGLDDWSSHSFNVKFTK